MADMVIESRVGDTGPSFIFRHFLHKEAKVSLKEKKYNSKHNIATKHRHI